MALDCPPDTCLPPNTTVVPCTDRPLEIGMLFAGGDCSFSAQCQNDKFICQDFNGGVPSTFGEEFYIQAFDDNLETLFFEGFVPIGSTYLMENGFERFPADQRIFVYRNENTTPENLLQDVQYHSSCSQNLDLLNRFGSHGESRLVISIIYYQCPVLPVRALLTFILLIFSFLSYCELVQRRARKHYRF